MNLQRILQTLEHPSVGKPHIEAKRKDITPFCLTVDKAGHNYLKTMCGDMSYEVRGDILDAAQHDIRDVPGLLLTL